MNSDKAADVRDSLNTAPCVAYGVDTREYSNKHTTIRGGREVTYTGEHVHLREYLFAPRKSTRLGKSGSATSRRCVRASRWCSRRSISREDTPAFVPRDIVFEEAKHDCLIRCDPDWTLRFRDDWQHRAESDSDGDRCPDCGCTRFRLQDGVPECERCGSTAELAIEELSHDLTIGDFE